MAAGDPFCTVPEAKTYLGLQYDTEDPTITRMVAAASDAVRSFCNREILQKSYTSTFIGNGGTRAFLAGDPIVSVESVLVDDVPILETQAGGSGYRLIGRTIHLFGCSFSRGSVCTVEYTAGYEAVPNDVKQATLRLVASWQAKRKTQDKESITANGETVKFETGPMPKDAERLLRNYVQHTPGA